MKQSARAEFVHPVLYRQGILFLVIGFVISFGGFGTFTTVSFPHLSHHYYLSPPPHSPSAAHKSDEAEYATKYHIRNDGIAKGMSRLKQGRTPALNTHRPKRRALMDIDCSGRWGGCNASCQNYFEIAVAQSGSGSACPVSPVSCYPGEGECPSAHGSVMLRMPSPLMDLTAISAGIFNALPDTWKVVSTHVDVKVTVMKVSADMPFTLTLGEENLTPTEKDWVIDGLVATLCRGASANEATAATAAERAACEAVASPTSTTCLSSNKCTFSPMVPTLCSPHSAGALCSNRQPTPQRCMASDHCSIWPAACLPSVASRACSAQTPAVLTCTAADHCNLAPASCTPIAQTCTSTSATSEAGCTSENHCAIAAATCTALPALSLCSLFVPSAEACLEENHCVYNSGAGTCTAASNACASVSNPTLTNCLDSNHCKFTPASCGPAAQDCASISSPTSSNCLAANHCAFAAATCSASVQSESCSARTPSHSACTDADHCVYRPLGCDATAASSECASAAFTASTCLEANDCEFTPFRPPLCKGKIPKFYCGVRAVNATSTTGAHPGLRQRSLRRLTTPAPEGTANYHFIGTVETGEGFTGSDVAAAAVALAAGLRADGSRSVLQTEVMLGSSHALRLSGVMMDIEPLSPLDPVLGTPNLLVEVGVTGEGPGLSLGDITEALNDRDQVEEAVAAALLPVGIASSGWNVTTLGNVTASNVTFVSGPVGTNGPLWVPDPAFTYPECIRHLVPASDDDPSTTFTTLLNSGLDFKESAGHSSVANATFAHTSILEGTFNSSAPTSTLADAKYAAVLNECPNGVVRVNGLHCNCLTALMQTFEYRCCDSGERSTLAAAATAACGAIAGLQLVQDVACPTSYVILSSFVG